MKTTPCWHDESFIRATFFSNQFMMSLMVFGVVKQQQSLICNVVQQKAYNVANTVIVMPPGSKCKYLPFKL